MCNVCNIYGMYLILIYSGFQLGSIHQRIKEQQPVADEPVLSPDENRYHFGSKHSCY